MEELSSDYRMTETVWAAKMDEIQLKIWLQLLVHSLETLKGIDPSRVNDTSMKVVLLKSVSEVSSVWIGDKITMSN